MTGFRFCMRALSKQEPVFKVTIGLVFSDAVMWSNGTQQSRVIQEHYLLLNCRCIFCGGGGGGGVCYLAVFKYCLFCHILYERKDIVKC